VSDKRDITEAAQKLLSSIYRTGQSFGLHYVIDILRGSNDKRILHNRHDQLSVYDIGGEYSKEQWLSIGDRLLELGLITMGEHKTYAITADGFKLLKGDAVVDIKEERLRKKVEKRPIKLEIVSSNYDRALFDKLRSLRKEIADENHIPAYIVFNDKTLRELSAHKPQTKEQMLEINGVGEVKFEKYGEAFLMLLRDN
jgi:ATP-dependent DNA helicase RecQ